MCGVPAPNGERALPDLWSAAPNWVLRTAIGPPVWRGVSRAQHRGAALAVYPIFLHKFLVQRHAESWSVWDIHTSLADDWRLYPQFVQQGVEAQRVFEDGTVGGRRGE